MFCKRWSVVLVVVPGLLVASSVQAAYSNGTEVLDVRAEIDAQLALLAPGQGVHFDLSGPATVQYTNAIPGVSVDIELTTMNLAGTVTVPGLGLSGTANATLFVPAGSIQGPGNSSGQLTPAASYFNAYTKINVINLGGNNFTMYTGLNNDHGGLKSSAFKADANVDTGDLGVGVYSMSRFPLDLQANANGSGITYMSPVSGAVWTITPEPGSLALLVLGLPLLRRRR